MRKPTCRLLALSLALSTAPLAAQSPSPSFDWARLQEEGSQLLSQYLRINTTNPPGNELETARWLQQVLGREGIESQILDTVEIGPGRANFYARLKGNGSRKAIALVHHMDVVPVSRELWHEDPFAGLIKDGEIWGRGAIDMKGHGIIQLMALIAIKRSGIPLTRDIVFIGNADEESGGQGAITMLEKHRDLLNDVEYLLTEGADTRVQDGEGALVWGRCRREAAPLDPDRGARHHQSWLSADRRLESGAPPGPRHHPRRRVADTGSDEPGGGTFLQGSGAGCDRARPAVPGQSP